MNTHMLFIKCFFKINFLLFCLPLLIFWGCSEDENFYNIINAPKSELCLTGFISPDSVYITLTRSLPYNYPLSGQNHYLLADTGTVWMEEEGTYFDTLFPVSINSKIIYTTKRKPSEGKTYTIYAYAPGFQNVEATVAVPNKVPISKFDTISFYRKIKIYKYLDYNKYDIRDTIIMCIKGTIYFNEPEDETNYYYYPFSNNYTYDRINFNPIIQYEIGIFDDRSIQGTEVALNFELEYKPYTINKIKLYSINKDYFKYLLWINYNITSSNKKLWGDIDIIEPIVSYSNTSNKIGMVAGYALSTIEISLQ